MSKSPCMECYHRHRACHDHCSKYKEWKEAEQSKKESIREHGMSIADEVHIENIYKSKRRANHE